MDMISDYLTRAKAHGGGGGCVVLRTQHDMLHNNDLSNVHTRRVNDVIHTVGQDLGVPVFPWDKIFNDNLEAGPNNSCVTVCRSNRKLRLRGSKTRSLTWLSEQFASPGKYFLPRHRMPFFSRNSKDKKTAVDDVVIIICLQAVPLGQHLRRVVPPVE